MQSPDSPESVVHAALEAAAAGRWRDVYRLLDAAELPRWRRVTLSMLRHIEQQPGADRALAEWGAGDAAQLELLPDEELFGRWMQAFSLQARSRMAFGPAEPPPAPTVRRVVLGSVPEGDDLAHVVYREIVGSGRALRIVTLRRTADGWKMGVDHDLLGVASFHFGPPQSEPRGTAP